MEEKKTTAEEYYNKRQDNQIDFNNAQQASLWIHSPEFVVDFAEEYNISKQREQLIVFLREYHTSMLVFTKMPDIETIVDDYLKSKENYKINQQIKPNNNDSNTNK